MSDIRSKSAWPALVLAAVALLASGCGGDNDSEEASGAGTSTEQKPYTIGVDLSLSTDPFFVAMSEGVKDEAKALGVKPIITYSSYDPGKQIADVQDFITRGVDGMLVSPAEVEASVPAYEAAQDAGIPIISIADHTDPAVETSFVGAPWDEFGSQIAEWTCEAAGGKGKIAMIKGSAGVSFVEEMEDGYKEYLSSECPGMTIAFEVNTNFAREEAVKAAQDALTANPDLRAIFTNIDDQAAGSAQAVQEAGKAGKVLITGFNGDKVGFEELKAGSIDMTIALKPYQWGRLGLRTLVDHLNGKKAPKLVRIDSQLLDKSNIGEVNLAELR